MIAVELVGISQLHLKLLHDPKLCLPVKEAPAEKSANNGDPCTEAEDCKILNKPCHI